MFLEKKIIRNIFSLAGAQTMAKIFALLSLPLIARFLGVEGFGRYVLCYTFILIFFQFADWGMGFQTIKEVSRLKEKTSQYLAGTFFLRLIFGIIFYLIMLLTIKILAYPHQIFLLVAILGLTVVFNNLSYAFYNIFYAHEKMHIPAIFQILFSFFSYSGIITLLYFGKSLSFIFLFVAVLSITNVFSIYLFGCIRKFKLGLVFERNIYLEIIKKSSPYAYLNILSILALQSGIIILSKFQGEEAVGLFSAPYKLILALSIIPGSIMGAYFPVFSQNYFKKKISELKKICRRTTFFLFFLSLFLAILITFFSTFVIRLIFGEEFIKASLFFVILIWANVLVFTKYPLGYIILSSDKISQWFKFALVSTIIYIVLNLFFIYFYGICGAAWAFLFSEMTSIFLIVYFSRRCFGVSLFK